MIIDPIGIICLFWTLLLHARPAILAKKPTLLSVAVRFLYREYDYAFYFWEIMEMVRRFFLVGMMVLVRRGTIVQVRQGYSLSLELPCLALPCLTSPCFCHAEMRCIPLSHPPPLTFPPH